MKPSKIMNTFHWQLIGLLAVFSSGCYKYKEGSPTPGSAYLRVFNSIPYNVSALTAGQTPPFLCFLLDPTFDASGAPSGGVVVGDWLQTRELYSVSYPQDAGTALDAGNGDYSNNPGNPTISYVTNANYEYPGKIHVPTAPAMNGLDLSAWAQVPSGKHRIMFVSRPESNTAFGDLASSLRNSVLIDTTVNLTSGEVYTLEALNSNIDSNKYGAYIRQEQFIHQNFDPGRLYSAFYNLGGTTSFLTTNINYPYYWFYPDTLAIHYTYNIFDDNYAGVGNSLDPNFSPPSTPLASADDVYMGTIIRGRDDLSVFTPMPFLSRSYFFDEQGVLRKYWEDINDSTGTMPYVSFTFDRTDPAAEGQLAQYPELLCTADPATYNTLDPDIVNSSAADPNYTTANPALNFIYQVNLNQVIESDTALNFYPTINVFEIIYDRIYLMQLERQFEKVPD